MHKIFHLAEIDDITGFLFITLIYASVCDSTKIVTILQLNFLPHFEFSPGIVSVVCTALYLLTNNMNLV